MFRKILIAALCAAPIPSAWACSTCSCGDYTITVTGLEKPYHGRLRGSLDWARREETTGEGADYERTQEQRFNVGLSWSPSARLTLGVQLPLVRKRVEDATLTQTDTEGVGDADLIARIVALRSAGPVPRHLAGFRLGVRLPTSEEVLDRDGDPVDIDSQPDAGATSPNVGLWYGYYHLPFLVSASTAYLFYGEGRQGFQPGDVALASLTVQYGFVDWALQLGADARHSQPNTFPGGPDPNTGGTLVMGTVGLVRRFGPDFVITAGVQTPVMRKLDGVQDEEPSLRAGVAYDFR